MRYLLVKGIAGMGNRMLFAVTAQLYSQLAGRRLLVDWSDAVYSGNGTNAFTHLFAMPDSAAEAPACETDSVYPAVWRGRLHMSARELVKLLEPENPGRFSTFRRYSANMAYLDYPEEVVVVWCYFHQIDLLRRHHRAAWPDLLGLSTEAILKRLLQEKLRLQPRVRQQIEEFKDAHWGGCIIGVHVRYTDRKVPLGRYYRHIDRILGEVPDARIFLATDNALIERAFRDRYAQVFSTPKAYPHDGRPMHGNAERTDRLDSAIEALMDMYLLAECDYLIYPRSSTFSYISSLLCDLPPERVIDVQRYNPIVMGKRLMHLWQLTRGGLFW